MQDSSRLANITTVWTFPRDSWYESTDLKKQIALTRCTRTTYLLYFCWAMLNSVFWSVGLCYTYSGFVQAGTAQRCHSEGNESGRRNDWAIFTPQETRGPGHPFAGTWVQACHDISLASPRDEHDTPVPTLFPQNQNTHWKSSLHKKRGN